MAAVEIHHIAGQQFTHARRQGAVSGLAKQVKMIGQEDPCVNVHCTVITEPGQALNKVMAVGIGNKNISFFNPPTHHMVQYTGSVQAALSWHRFDLS